jgi:hypothetical protein
MTEAIQRATSSPYKRLVEAFASSKDRVLEIEILGAEVTLPDGQFLLQDELCIGIHKKMLAKAFLEARTTFMQRCESVDEDVRPEFSNTAMLSSNVKFRISPYEKVMVVHSFIFQRSNRL